MWSWGNLRNLVAGGTRRREEDDTRALFLRVKALHDASPYASDDSSGFIADLALDACERAELIPSTRLLGAMWDCVDDLIVQDQLLFGFASVGRFEVLSTDEAVQLRTYLRRKEQFLLDHVRRIEIWREKVICIFAGVLQYLPSTAFRQGWNDEDTDEGLPGMSVPLADLCENAAEAIERTMMTFFDDDVTNADLFTPLRDQLQRRAYVASGMRFEERHSTRREPTLPTKQRDMTPSRIAELYLGDSPWKEFFLTRLPFGVPFPVRFEHTHVIGGSGHGKTQFLQLSIVRDLVESAADGRSLVVIDSQGDLIRAISKLSFFSPDSPTGFADRLMLIDPADVEYPVALNMFDFKQEEIARLPLVERERVLNGTIELYEYFFGALLGAELTAKQGIIFKYLARLLLEIPDATIHTFRSLMENGEPFRPYMEKLPPTARAFFETRFFDRSFNETKKQVLTRLWGVLSNATFDRMFSHPRSKVDLFGALQQGKIILINTAKDLLKEEGASILGRFFIALIAQTAMRRATLPAHERRPCFVYIDEAADYFDDKIGALLNQARKYKVGMVLAHQNLDQLTPALRASIFASTSIKLAGGVSGKDASALCSEMHTDSDFLLAQKKGRRETSFACYVRNITPHALNLSIPLGTAEALPVMSDDNFSRLLDLNRQRIAVALKDVPLPLPAPRSTGKPARLLAPPPQPVGEVAKPTPRAQPRPEEPVPLPITPVTPEVAPKLPAVATAPKDDSRTIVAPAPVALGRGGREHQYLQHLLKEFGLSKGYRAVIEEPILEGAGRVDVALTKADLRIACEISVTTGRDQELGNIEKCIDAGFAHVVLVSADRRYLKAMEKLCANHLEDRRGSSVHFKTPEETLTWLDEIGGGMPTEATVRGYKVKVKRTHIDPREAEGRRAAVAAVIANAMRRSKEPSS